MHEFPIATSSPIRSKIKQMGRRKSKNSRRSLSLFDVSVIDATPDVSSQKSESNETLTSVCKDSGYVRSDGSWLEDDDSRESKDLVEELKFKNVLISELQESNRGLRLRCADAENKIVRLRIQCEAHCGCCLGDEDGLDTEFPLPLPSSRTRRDIPEDVNSKYVLPFKRHSLAVSKFSETDRVGWYRNRVPPKTPQPGISVGPRNQLVRSSSTGTIATQTPRDVESYKIDVSTTPESLSLSKVQWWQSELSTQAHRLKEPAALNKAAERKLSQAHLTQLNPNDRDNLKTENIDSTRTSDSTVLTSCIAYNEADLDQSDQGKEKVEKLDSTRTSKNAGLTSFIGQQHGLSCRSPPFVRVDELEQYLHLQQSRRSGSPSKMEYAIDYSELKPTRVPSREQDRFDSVGLASSVDDSQGSIEQYTSSFLNGDDMEMHLRKPEKSFPLNSAKHSILRNLNANHGVIIRDMADLSSNKKLSFESASPIDDVAGAERPKGSIRKCSSSDHCNSSCNHCDCMARPSSQVIIIPSGCCCKLMGNLSSALPPESTCCKSEGVSRWGSNCNESFTDAYPSDQQPLFVLKNKGGTTSAAGKDSSRTSTSTADNAYSEVGCPDAHTNTRQNSTCHSDCQCATPFPRGLTVPFAQRYDAKSEMKRIIEEGMKRITSTSRTEIESLRFKPWPPPDFSKMSPLLHCLAETSHYAQQMALVAHKVDRQFQRAARPFVFT